MKFKIPCLHDRGLVSSSEVVADYYPLKLEEVLAMLQIAHHCDPDYRSNETLINQIHERLRQGIMGMTCPYPDKGEIASRCAKVDELFLKTTDNRDSFNPELALLIFELMTFKKNPEDVQ